MITTAVLGNHATEFFKLPDCYSKLRLATRELILFPDAAILIQN